MGRLLGLGMGMEFLRLVLLELLHAVLLLLLALHIVLLVVLVMRLRRHSLEFGRFVWLWRHRDFLDAERAGSGGCS
jgi:hypothetical protein